MQTQHPVYRQDVTFQKQGLYLCALLCTWLCGLSLALAAPSSKPATQAPHTRSQRWHKQQIAAHCGTTPKQVLQVLRYRLPATKATARGLTIAVIQGPKTSTKAVALLHPNVSKGNTNAHHCVVFGRFVCAPGQGTCRHSARALQLLDLKGTALIKPEAGSWYEAPLATPKTLRWPALVLQSSVRYGPKGARQTREQTSILWLRRGSPLLAFQAMSLELWSPKHAVLKGLQAGGIRIESMQLRQRPHMPPELYVIKKGIPTALNRCICQRLDASRSYRLTTKGFRQIHSL